MANRIEVRGVIVPSEYDVDFMYSYIKRGMITPESYVRNAITQADPKKDIDLYINSPGGSVFAGNEMINALQDWAVENKKGFNIIIGAMAASMGSALLVSLNPFAKSVQVHSNSKIMFHGAYGGAIGGSEAMKDYSELLDKINNDIKVQLISRYDLAPEQVEEWFSEGREGWLSAEQAIAIGMADKIIGQEDELPESADIDFNEKGMKIAALTLQKFNGDESMNKITEMLRAIFNIDNEATEDEVLDLAEEAIKLQGEEEDVHNESTDTEETEPTESESTDEGEQAEEVAPEASGDAESDGNETEDAPAESADVEEEEEVIEEEVQDLHQECMELNETVNSLNEALNKKQSENDKLKADMDKLTSRFENLLGGGFNAPVEEEAPTDWKSCVEKCGGDYVEARKQFPDMFAKMFGKK